MGCNCGKSRRARNASANSTPSSNDRPSNYVDPTRALFAAARPQYEVKGKRFSTQTAAEEYARRIGARVRVL